jgi:hypothetical protein
MKALKDAGEARRFIMAFEHAELQLIAEIEQFERRENQKRRQYQC